MSAVEPVYWKIIDMIIVVAIFLAALGAVQLINNENFHIHLKNTKDVALFRDSSLAAPNKLHNASFTIHEDLRLVNNFKSDCKIGFELKNNPLYDECIINNHVKILEFVKQPDIISFPPKPGGYLINVNA